MPSPCKKDFNAIRAPQADRALPGTVQNLTLYTRAYFVFGNRLSPHLSGWMARRYGLREAGDGEDGASHTEGHWGRCELRGAWRDSSEY